MATPTDFCRVFPSSSVLQKMEAERIATNIMVILARTGDEWRELSWKEYEEERKADHETDKGGGFKSYLEKPYFDKVLRFTVSEEDARCFSNKWFNID